MMAPELPDVGDLAALGALVRALRTIGREQAAEAWQDRPRKVADTGAEHGMALHRPAAVLLGTPPVPAG
jgi:hypothetical protein